MAQDPWAVVSEKQATARAKKPASSDPWAVVSTQSAAPDFSAGPTNTEGLYEMYGRTGKGEEVGRISVPYSKVPAALASGFTWYGTSGRLGENPQRERYTKDKAAEGKTPSLWEKTKSFAAQATAPIPDIPLTEVDPQHPITSRWMRLSNAAQNIEQMPANVVNSTLRGVAGLAALPEQGWEILKGIHEGDLNAIGELQEMTPPGIGVNLYKAYQRDSETLGPVAALANLGGNLATLYVAGKIGGKISEKVPKSLSELREAAAGRVQGAGEKLRGAAKTMTGAGPRGVGKLVRDTQTENVARAEKAAEKNATSAQEHLEKTQEALHKTLGAELETEAANKAAKTEALKKTQEAQKEHQAKTEEVRKHNENVLRDRAKRQQAQQKLDSASEELEAKIETAQKTAKGADDAAWDDWREKVAGAEAPSDTIVAAIKESKSIMDPEDVAEFRKVLQETKPTGADASELQTTRDSIAKQNHFGEDYDNSSPENKKAIDRIVADIGLDPDAAEAEVTKPIGADRLHVWKTQLEYAVRKATRGNVRYAIGKVLDSVRATEDQLSEAAGAGEELAKARALHGPYADTFRNSPNEPATVASKSLGETAPEHVKAQARTERLQMLGRYDAEIPKLAAHIANLQEGLKALPAEAPLREQIKPLPPRPEPIPMPALKQPERTAPPDRPPEVKPEVRTLGPEDIRARHRADLQATADLMANLGRRRMDWSVLTGVAGVIAGVLGEFKGAGLVELAGGGAIAAPFISEGFANFLERPGVIAKLEKITPADIEKVPPELRSQALQDLRPLLTAARGRGAKINPAVWVLAASAAGATQQPKKSLKDLRGEAEKNKPPEAAAPAGPQSSVQPYTHIFNEQTGRIEAANAQPTTS